MTQPLMYLYCWPCNLEIIHYAAKSLQQGLWVIYCKSDWEFRSVLVGKFSVSLCSFSKNCHYWASNWEHKSKFSLKIILLNLDLARTIFYNHSLNFVFHPPVNHPELTSSITDKLVLLSLNDIIRDIYKLNCNFQIPVRYKILYLVLRFRGG